MLVALADTGVLAAAEVFHPTDADRLVRALVNAEQWPAAAAILRAFLEDEADFSRAGLLDGAGGDVLASGRYLNFVYHRASGLAFFNLNPVPHLVLRAFLEASHRPELLADPDALTECLHSEASRQALALAFVTGGRGFTVVSAAQGGLLMCRGATLNSTEIRCFQPLRWETVDPPVQEAAS